MKLKSPIKNIKLYTTSGWYFSANFLSFHANFTFLSITLTSFSH